MTIPGALVPLPRPQATSAAPRELHVTGVKPVTLTGKVNLPLAGRSPAPGDPGVVPRAKCYEGAGSRFSRAGALNRVAPTGFEPALPP